MKKVLVTGGAGFIGYYIVEELVKRGYEAVVFDMSLPGGEVKWLYDQLNADVKFFRGDVSELASLLKVAMDNKVEAIVHGAALTDVELLENAPLQSLKVNTVGTVNAMEVVRLLGLQRLVTTSTIAVYAPKQYEPMDETHPVLLPNAGPALATYTSAKIAAEAFGMHYWHQYGTSFVGVRFSGVYGFGMKYPIYIKPLVENAVKGIPTVFESGGDARRDFVYVKDVAKGVLAALEAKESDLHQRIFNIAHGGALKNVFDLAEMVKLSIPAAAIEVGAGLTDYEAQIDKSRGELSIASASQQLKYKPMYDLKAGVKEYVEMYRQYINRE